MPSKVVRPFIEHRGTRYYRDAQGWRASACKGHKRLHVVLWEEENGPVPDGFHLFCSNPDRPSLASVEMRPAYAGMQDTRERIVRAAHDWWTPERIARLKALAEQGLCFKEIKAAMRAHDKRLHRGIILAGVSLQLGKRGKKPLVSGARVKRLLDLHEAGCSISEIAAEFGCHRNTVGRELNHRGIYGRSRWGLPPNLQPRCGEGVSSRP